MCIALMLCENNHFIFSERSRSGATIPEVGEQQLGADLLGAVNQPHLLQPAIEERKDYRTNEEDTITLSTRNANGSGKRKNQAESTSNQGTVVSFKCDV